MCDLDANLYFYEFINEVVLVAKNVDGGTNPEDFPFPCQSGKCVREVQYTSSGERKWNAAISVSFGKYLNLTIPLFGQLVAQSLLKLLLLPILNKSFKDYLQLFELLLSR